MINFWLTIKSLLLVKLSQLKHLNSTERWLTRNTMKKFFDSLKVWTFSTCESRLLQRKLPNRAQKSPQQRLFLTKNFFQRTCLLNSGPGLLFSTIVKISSKLHRECFFPASTFRFKPSSIFFSPFRVRPTSCRCCCWWRCCCCCGNSKSCFVGKTGKFDTLGFVSFALRDF